MNFPEIEIPSYRVRPRGVFKSTWDIIKKLPAFIFLIALTILALWLWGKTKGPGSLEGTGSVEVAASEIERILEMNTASQEVSVTTDTTYVSTGHLVKLMGIELFPQSTMNRLTETRHFMIKAGSSHFNIVGSELFIKKPSITSCDEMPDRRRVVLEEGSWSAIGIQSVAIKAKSAAKVAALEHGILERAMVNTELALSEMGLIVIWEE